MPFSLPFPSVPQNGQTGDATPILANELALAQAISAFDGSQINAKSVTENALADAINPRLRALETIESFVFSGCIWSALSGLNATMTGGTIYVNGYRTIVSGVGSNTFTASNDTYIDIDYLGNVYYNGVSNNATAPSLTANSIRVAKVVTSGSAVTSVVQAQNADGIGNIIYPIGAGSADDLQNPYKFSVWKSASAQTIATSATQVVFDAKEFDTGNNYSTSTNTFTAPVAGYYNISASLYVTANGSLTAAAVFIYKNGASIKSGLTLASATVSTSVAVHAHVLLAATDAITIYGQGYGNAFSCVNDETFTRFSAFLISAS